MRTGSNPRQDIQHPRIHFPGICLTGYRVTLLKAHLLRNHRINLVNRFLVSIKQFLKACLCPGRSLRTQQFHCFKHMFQIFQIHQKLLHPQGCPLTYCCRLRRLEMGKCQCRLRFIFICKLCQLCNYIHQLFPNQAKRLCHHDNVGIVAYIAGSRPQVDDAFRLRTLYAISIYMGHDIVAHQLFPLFRHLIIDILGVGFQLRNLLFRDIQPQFLFCLSQRYPELPPGAEFHIR